MSRDGRPVLAYNYGEVSPPSPEIPPVQARSAYLHPVWSPSGRVVTGDFPADHPHQRGIFFPWTRTEFEGRNPDFWNLGSETGTVRFEAVDAMFSGPVLAQLQVRHRHVDLSQPEEERDALQEVWRLRAYVLEDGDERVHLIDLLSTQVAAGPQPLKVLEYRYGGLAFRGAHQWIEGPVEFLTSQGASRGDGDGTRVHWSAVSGPLNGEPAGVLVLGHPANFRAPQVVRIHPKVPYLNLTPVQLGEFEISADRPFVSRYRFVVIDGRVESDEADRWWRDFAEPPTVRSP